MFRRFAVGVFLLMLVAASGQAGVKTKAAGEAAEYVLRKFGVEAAGETAETLTRKIEVFAVKHGDEALAAVKRVGPRSFRIAEEAGEHAPAAVRLMARHGDEALWVVTKKSRMALLAKHGDNAAEAMIKHGEIAEPLVESLGKPAADALKSLSAQNGRRLAMLAEDGTLPKIGRTEALLQVVAQHGDRAMDFIWRNKGPLTVAAALTAFLANPQPFLDGTADITRVVADSAARPLAAAATEAARRTHWTAVLAVGLLLAGALVALKIWLRHRAALRTVQSGDER